MNYFDFFSMANPGAGLRKPAMGEGYQLYSDQPMSNLGLSMPSTDYGDGLGLKAPEFFGQMVNPSNINPMLGFSLLDAGKKQSVAMPKVQLPGGSNLTYEQLMKFYGLLR